jgi:hypothetical protein
MATIYLEMAKKFLTDQIIEIRNAAIIADGGAVNCALSWVGLGRDKDVSKAKQKLADELVAEIKGLVDKNNDLETCRALKALIDKCKADAAAISSEAGYNEGSFGPGMTRVRALNKMLYKNLESLEMLEIPYNKDPFNIYLYHIADYFSRKVLKSTKELTFMERLIANPKITSAALVSTEKKKLIIANLANCKDKLLADSVASPEYPAGRRDWVLAFIHALSTGNSDVSNKHTYFAGVSLSLAFFTKMTLSTSTVGHGVATLHECLLAAFQEVKSTNLKDIAAAIKKPKSDVIKEEDDNPIPNVIKEGEDEYGNVDLTSTLSI